MFMALNRVSSKIILAAACVLSLGTLPSPLAAAVNPGVAEVDSPGKYGWVAVISDVHGMYEPLVTLLRNAKVIDSGNKWAAGNTLLIVTGDSINKGPDSVDTIDLWMSLSRQAPAFGGRVIHLLGNHEAELLFDAKGSGKTNEFREELKEKGMQLREFTRPGYPRADFIYSMPVAARVGKWLFCHSGLLPDNTWEHFTAKAAAVVQSGDYGAKFLLGPDSVLESDDWWATAAGRNDLERRLSDNGLFGVVFGHRTKALNIEGRNGISGDRRIIKIDNGMSPDAGSNPGELLVFTEPAELAKASPATVHTISSDGTAKLLKP